MEGQSTFDWTIIIAWCFSCVAGLFSFISLRIVSRYDGQFHELFERTKDLPAIREAIEEFEKRISELCRKVEDLPAFREAIEWLKESLREKK